MKPRNIYIKGYIQQQSFIFSRNKLINKKRFTLMQVFCQTTPIFLKFSMKHSLCFKFFFSFCVLLCYNPTRKGHFSPLVHEVRCANFFFAPPKRLIYYSTLLSPLAFSFFFQFVGKKCCKIYLPYSDCKLLLLLLLSQYALKSAKIVQKKFVKSSFHNDAILI